MFKTRLRRIATAATIISTCGCHEYLNPWKDTTVGPDQVTTASVKAARAHVGEPRTVQRSNDPIPLHAQDGTVPHFPLWWEDPFEDRGSEDGQFAWTGEDYLAMPYGLGRMILNTIAIPVSLVVQPPVPLMGSDGIVSKQALGYDHDPTWYSDGASVVPPDVQELQESGSAPASREDTDAS
jgi:hypothetical protein